MDRDRSKPDYLLDTKQTAIFLGVSVRTILRWKRKGQMPQPAVDNPNKCLWSRQSIIDRFIVVKSDKVGQGD